MVGGFKYAQYNDLESVKELVNPNTCAIMVEVIQGEGGIRVAQEEFLKGLREVCDEHNLLLIFDEVQCGLGRTGHHFAWQKMGIFPEIMPGIVTALILTFSLSFDDFVISYFTAGYQVSTLAITIYSMARKSVNPQINALSTLMFLTVLVLLLLVNIRTTRDLRDKQNQGDLRK